MVAGWSALTYFMVRRTHGPRERRFTIFASIICFLGILALTALDTFVIKGIASAIGVIIFFTIFLLRRRQLEIRREEAADA
jgi:CHASE2 domain-containing sensor protein